MWQYNFCERHATPCVMSCWLCPVGIPSANSWLDFERTLCMFFLCLWKLSMGRLTSYHSPKICLLAGLATLYFLPHSDELVICLCCTLPSPEGQHMPAPCNAVCHFTSVKWLVWTHTSSCTQAWNPHSRPLGEDNVPMLVASHQKKKQQIVNNMNNVTGVSYLLQLSYLNIFKRL